MAAERLDGAAGAGPLATAPPAVLATAQRAGSCLVEPAIGAKADARWEYATPVMSRSA